jgi:glycosyltransferase involved in cell wall biosynthesis
VNVKTFTGRTFLIVPGNLGAMGGAERQSILLGKYLREIAGANVVFLGWTGEGAVAEELRRLDLKFLTFQLYWGNSKCRRLLNYAKLARFIRKKIRPHYILPYVGYHCKVIGMIWKFTGARYCWWNQRDEGRGIYGSKIDRLILNSLPEIVSNSFEGRDFLISKCGVAPGRVRVINNAILLPPKVSGAEWRQKLQLNPKDRLILMVANLTEFKDHRTLVNAFALLPRELTSGGRCHLALAGKFGETTLDLKALAFDKGLCGVLHFLGPVADIDGLYSAADLVAHSSTTEGCPNGVLEAMAHGKCVVGTNIGGLRQALGEEMAGRCLAAPGDCRALSERLSNYLESEDEREKAGQANQDRIIAEFSWHKHGAEVLDGISAFEAR